MFGACSTLKAKTTLTSQHRCAAVADDSPTPQMPTPAEDAQGHCSNVSGQQFGIPSGSCMQSHSFCLLLQQLTGCVTPISVNSTPRKSVQSIWSRQYSQYHLEDLCRKHSTSKTTIFRQSLETGLFPMDWQTTNIASVFKKKDGNKAKNYRPVSLTSVTCNLLEHIIYRHLLTHFEKHHILTSRKYGFRPGYSSETQ